MSFLRKLGSLFDEAPPPPKQTGTAPAADDSAAAPEFVWQLLDSPSGTHMQFLDRDYAPVGLIDLIAREPRLVLDVGCYCGATGALIKRRWPGATVIGIEPLAEAAEHAAGRIDRVVNSTMEEVKFEEIGLSPGSVDTIVFADVLEHMYNPWSALQMARNLLTDDGVVLASIPNVRNLGLIASLLGGRWKYEGFGLLDITHIRFFTLAEVRNLFAETGFRLEAVVHGIDPPFAHLPEMEPDKDLINLQMGSLIFSNSSRADRLELATRQFFVRAGKSS